MPIPCLPPERQPGAADPAVAGPDAADPTFPWDADPAPEDPDAARMRHDGFTQARKALFLKALVKTGCVTEAAGRVGVGARTIYRHQESDDIFSDHCALALRMSATPLELTAWQRAVEGVEEHYVAGGQVRMRTRYSEGLLRLLLQGADPKKYGARQGFKRKRLLKHERRQMEREVRAELAGRQDRYSFEEAIESLERKLVAMDYPIVDADDPPEHKRAAGWTQTADGYWIPPGYGPLAAAAPPRHTPDAAGTPGDSV